MIKILNPAKYCVAVLVPTVNVMPAGAYFDSEVTLDGVKRTLYDGISARYLDIDGAMFEVYSAPDVNALYLNKTLLTTGI